jgi:hypothetical protein
MTGGRYWCLLHWIIACFHRSGEDPLKPQDIDATAYIFMFFNEVSGWMDNLKLKAEL